MLLADAHALPPTCNSSDNETLRCENRRLGCALDCSHFIPLSHWPRCRSAHCESLADVQVGFILERHMFNRLTL